MSEVQIRELYDRWRYRGSEKDREKLFESIWRHYHPRLQVFLTRFISGTGDKEDMVSEILLHAFESIGSYNSRYAFSTWIYRVARNKCIDRLRKKGLAIQDWGEQEPEDTETPEALVMRNVEKDMVKEAVGRLSETDRELVFLRFYEEMKYRDIASVTGMPIGTVKFRMSAIRKAMKNELEKRYFGGRESVGTRL